MATEQSIAWAAEHNLSVKFERDESGDVLIFVWCDGKAGVTKFAAQRAEQVTIGEMIGVALRAFAER